MTTLTGSPLTGGPQLDSPLLDSAAASHAEHLARVGGLPDLTPEQIRRAVDESGLAGRGGAAFPTGRKLATVAGGRRPVVVGDAAEGEPASSKDRVLLERSPHLVLDGLALAARAVGATTAYLYAPADLLRSSVVPALAERRDRVPVRVVAAPDTFVSGQESAVVAAIEGGPALPTSARPPVFERGVQGRPTLVHNVETLAHLALVVRLGPGWFRSAGARDEPGTRLFTVSGAVRHPGVVELPGGSPLGAIVDAVGGPTEPLQALLVGGYHGGWVPWSPLAGDVPCTRAALRRWHASPGAGVVVALPRTRCGLQAGSDVAAYLAGQSARQCGPCRNGLPTLAGLLHRVAYGAANGRDLHELERIAGLVDGRGACRHPGGTVRLVRSTVSTFATEFGLHRQGRCSGTARRDRS